MDKTKETEEYNNQNVSKANWKRPVITVLAVFVIVLATGGLVWFLMDKNSNDIKLTNEKSVKILEATIKELKNNNNSEVITVKDKPTALILTDQEILIMETLRKTHPSQDEYYAIRVNANDGTWAVTTPIPVLFSAASGYSIPGRGGAIFLWQKINGSWIYIGSGGEGGWSDPVKAKFNEIPKTIISDIERTPVNNSN